MPDDLSTPSSSRPRRTPGRRAAAAPEPAEGRLAVGRILRPWGVRGELKVEPLTDFPERFAPGSRLWVGDAAYVVLSARWHRGALLVGFEGVDDAAARAMRGALIETPEAELPELPPDTYYRHQLIGIEVRSMDGTALGRIVDVLDTGANEVFVVRGEAGELLVPAIGDVVREVDLAGRRMTIELLEGLLPEPKERPRQTSRPAGGR